MKLPGKIFNSIFTKLIVIFFITGMLVNLLVGGFFRHVLQSIDKTPFKNNIAQYVNYIVDDLGSPPSMNRADEISKNSSLDIYYKGPGVSWSTSRKFNKLEECHSHVWTINRDVKFKFCKGEHFVSVIKGEDSFVFALSGSPPHRPRERLVVFVIMLLSIMIIFAYLATRLVLKPLRSLSEGVREVGKGNLEHEVRVRQKDELGDLAAAFNQMTGRIKKMVKSREQLLIDVSHELRSPLTRIRLSMEFLPDNEIKQSIKEDLTEIEKMISEILESARLDAQGNHIRKVTFDAASLFHQIIAKSQTLKPGLSSENFPEKLTVSGDPDKLKTVFENIIGNALKYSDENNGPVRVVYEHAPGFHIFRIIDTGIGIPEEDLPQVFEPFYRADKSRSKETGGFGLGLSLCKKIIDAHQGKIEVDSILHQGTTVTIHLPE